MKSSPAYVLLLFIAFFLTFSSVHSQSLVGSWKGEDNGEVGVITFDKNGYVSFTINGESIGGKGYKAEGMVFDMVYETDDASVPHHMDFVIKMDDGSLEISRMQGIYSFVDDKTLIINMKFDGSERPQAFDSGSDDEIRLTKMKKAKKK